MVRNAKSLMGALLLIVVGFIALSTFSSEPTRSSKALHSLVSQTHRQLNQLHKLKEKFEGDQPPDSSILLDLGFVDQPILYPRHEWKNLSSPVIVSAVSSESMFLIMELMRTSASLSTTVSVVVFSLDLDEDELKRLQIECNTSCEVTPFEFEKYPEHVRDLRLGAYRPIIIQEMLQRTSEVLWLDAGMRVLVVRSEGSLLESWRQKAISNGGVVSWLLPNPHKLPTTALTHPDMFPAFRVNKHDYDFQKISDPKAVYIINNNGVHQKLMKPWVNCALTSNCLSPIGAQDTGCNFKKKPLFRYSGCHLYDTSAFNVALGVAFGVDNATYMEDFRMFQCLGGIDGARISFFSGWDSPLHRKEAAQEAQKPSENDRTERRKRHVRSAIRSNILS